MRRLDKFDEAHGLDVASVVEHAVLVLRRRNARRRSARSTSAIEIVLRPERSKPRPARRVNWGGSLLGSKLWFSASHEIATISPISMTKPSSAISISAAMGPIRNSPTKGCSHPSPRWFN